MLQVNWRDLQPGTTYFIQRNRLPTDRDTGCSGKGMGEFVSTIQQGLENYVIFGNLRKLPSATRCGINVNDDFVEVVKLC